MTDQEVKSVIADNVKLGKDGEQARNFMSVMMRCLQYVIS